MTDEPGAQALNTPVADLPDGAHDRPSSTEPLEIMGAALAHEP